MGIRYSVESLARHRCSRSPFRAPTPARWPLCVQGDVYQHRRFWSRRSRRPSLGPAVATAPPIAPVAAPRGCAPGHSGSHRRQHAGGAGRPELRWSRGVRAVGRQLRDPAASFRPKEVENVCKVRCHIVRAHQPAAVVILDHRQVAVPRVGHLVDSQPPQTSEPIMAIPGESGPGSCPGRGRGGGQGFMASLDA